MQLIWKTSVCKAVLVLATLAAGLIFGSLAVPTALAGDAMPVAQQNALVQKYCAVCHTDAARNGGLSLEHFDAAQASPSVAAMMISKLTSGVSLETVKAAASDPSAAALVAQKMKSGAMGAAGIARPEEATIDALIDALASEATGAYEWEVNRTQDPGTKATVLTASILRELPSARNAGEAAMYRLVLGCNAATHEGEMQLAWAPVAKLGTLSAAVDGNAPIAYNVEGTETTRNGSQVTAGAAITLFESEKGSHNPRIPLPAEALRITDLFPNESVEFPFGSLSREARQSLTACFSSDSK